MSLQKNIEQQWYGKPTWLWLLSPLSAVFWALSQLRKNKQKKTAYQAPCPVVVVGNIAVGGTGKTPVIIALAKALKVAGLKPVIISRGYGVNVQGVVEVPVDGSPQAFGDEPVMIAQNAGCQVLVGRDRVAAASMAAEQLKADVILCDDGMQHYCLGRTFELAVLDASRGLGNGWCLPVGPLRELKSRLKTVDWVFINGEAKQLPAPLLAELTKLPYADAQLQATAWVNVKTGLRCSLQDMFSGETVNAVAGIGNPQRFYRTLRSLGVAFKPHDFPDHHHFSATDFSSLPTGRVVMTEKDAVKCAAFAEESWWYLAVEFVLPKVMVSAVVEHCQQFQSTSVDSASDS